MKLPPFDREFTLPEFTLLVIAPFAPEPAQGGRSVRLNPLARVVLLFCTLPFARLPGGWLELPKPCGARPRSVVLPCASQVRVAPLALFVTVPLVTPRLLNAPPFVAVGGRFCES